MRRDRIRLSRRHQGWIYATFGILLVTGAVWLVARTWFHGDDDFGAATSPLAPWAMKLHGAASMAFLILLGTLLQGHVRQAWHARRSRWTGAGVLAGVGLLILSGYGLYYLGDETVREVASVLHWAVGLILPVVLVWHVRAGRRARVGQLPGRRRRATQGVEPKPPEQLAAGARIG